MPITGGSTRAIDSKRQRRAYLREVNHVAAGARSPLPPYAVVPITFSAEDCHAGFFPHTDALVISANISRAEIRRILIDEGSSVDILFASAYDKMELSRSLLT